MTKEYYQNKRTGEVSEKVWVDDMTTFSLPDIKDLQQGDILIEIKIDDQKPNKK